MTVILIFHPDLRRSRANRALLEAASKLAELEVVDMSALYPDGRIDVDVEVGRLLAAERLVLQFPVQWYSTPPLLKAWQDAVLTRMVYLAPQAEGARLIDMPLLVAATAGNFEAAYRADGANLFSLAQLLWPLQATAHRCGFRWAEPHLVYEADKVGPEALALEGRRYAARLDAWRSEPSRRTGFRSGSALPVLPAA